MRSLEMLGGSILIWAGVGLGQAVAAARAESPPLSPPALSPAPSLGVSLGATPSSSTRTETRVVANFHRIALSAIGNLEVRQGPNESLSITAEERVLSEIVSKVSDGTLELSMRPGTQLPGMKDIRYAVTVKSLDGLNLSGLGRAEVIDLRSDALEIKLSGSGDISLTRLDAGSLAIELSGQGKVTASGRAARQKVQLSGLGSYLARDLASKEATVILSGSGSMVVNVERALDAIVSGVGDIEYHGSPTVKRKVSGVGQIRQG